MRWSNFLLSFTCARSVRVGYFVWWGFVFGRFDEREMSQYSQYFILEHLFVFISRSKLRTLRTLPSSFVHRPHKETTDVFSPKYRPNTPLRIGFCADVIANTSSNIRLYTALAMNLLEMRPNMTYLWYWRIDWRICVKFLTYFCKAYSCTLYFVSSPIKYHSVSQSVSQSIWIVAR